MTALNDASKLNTKQFPTWCPGCGDFAIWGTLKAALASMSMTWEQLVVVYGVGCSGNMSSFIKAFGYHGLHGRALPTAAGIKLANHKLKVVVVAGDGDLLGEGMAHFIASCRANHDVTVILHNNQVYGLTTGQNSPTSMKGTKSKSTPLGVVDEPINPIQLAITAGAKHVSRGFAGDMNHLTNLIVEGINYEGFSFIDVLQPCVTFNKLNTYQWFRDKVKYQESPESNALEAISSGVWTEDEIRIGTFYKAESTAFHKSIRMLDTKTLIQNQPAKQDLSGLMEKYR